MSATKSVTVRLDPTEYERLAAEAERLGVPPDMLAETYVRAGLTSGNELGARNRHQAGIAALDGLAALRERLPEVEPVDVVQLIREGREELGRRTVA